MPQARILIVEDEALVARDTKESLEEMGYAVLAPVASGEEAVQKAGDNRPDAVLMDIHLRGRMDGIDAAVEICDRFQVPVIFLTAYADRELLDRAKEAGSFGYVIKPYDQRALAAMLEMALAKAASERAQRQAEEALRDSEERYRQVVSSSTDAVMVFDAETREFIEVNEACTSLYGYSRDEFLNMSHSEITSEQEASDDSIQKTLEGKLDSIPLRYHRKKDGSVFPVEISASTFTYKGRRVICGVVRDFTERKKTEQELLDYQTQLQRLALELSSTEERERRRVAEDLHDHASQSLAALVMNLQMLRKADLSEDHAEALERSVEMLRRMSADIRTLTFELCPPMLYEMGLSPAVAYLVEQFQKQHDGNFHFSDDGQPKPLNENTRALVYRAVRELLVNATRHADARAVTVSMAGGDGYLSVTVEDDGVGFYASDATSGGRKGAGLGLFSIRERLGLIGGRLEVESEPGQGSRLKMVVPLGSKET